MTTKTPHPSQPPTEGEQISPRPTQAAARAGLVIRLPYDSPPTTTEGPK